MTLRITSDESRTTPCLPAGRNHGFTLLEVLIAGVIFTAGIVVIAGQLSYGMLGTIDAENTIIATKLAERGIEEMRNWSFSLITDEARADVNIDIDGDTNNDFAGFQREVAVTAPAVDPDMSDLKQVTITIYWTFKDSQLNVPLKTYISRN